MLHWDPGTGSPYLRCDATGRTQWCEASLALGAMADGTQGFRRVPDPASGAWYFEHEGMGTVVWGL